MTTSRFLASSTMTMMRARLKTERLKACSAAPVRSTRKPGILPIAMAM